MNKKARYYFWILAGVYLVYRGGSMVKAKLSGAQISMGILLAGVSFVAIGIVFCVLGIREIRRVEIESANAGKEPGDEQPWEAEQPGRPEQPGGPEAGGRPEQPGGPEAGGGTEKKEEEGKR